MLYLEKGQQNELILNINNNTDNVFSGYTLEFTHIMSKEVKTYTINTSDPDQYQQNIRYCTIFLDLGADDLNYQGQYNLNIYGNGVSIVFIGIVMLNGPAETNPFTQYISYNEVNENTIYIQE